MVNEKFRDDLVIWNSNKSEIDEIHKHMKKYQDRIKALKGNNENIEKKLIKYMKNNNLNDKKLVIDNFKISLDESKRSESISKGFLLEKLTMYFNNEERAKKIVDYIYESREVTSKYVLKRNCSKKK